MLRGTNGNSINTIKIYEADILISNKGNSVGREGDVSSSKA